MRWSGLCTWDAGKQKVRKKTGALRQYRTTISILSLLGKREKEKKNSEVQIEGSRIEEGENTPSKNNNNNNRGGGEKKKKSHK